MDRPIGSLAEGSMVQVLYIVSLSSGLAKEVWWRGKLSAVSKKGATCRATVTFSPMYGYGETTSMLSFRNDFMAKSVEGYVHKWRYARSSALDVKTEEVEEQNAPGSEELDAISDPDFVVSSGKDGGEEVNRQFIHRVKKSLQKERSVRTLQSQLDAVREELRGNVRRVSILEEFLMGRKESFAIMPSLSDPLAFLKLRLGSSMKIASKYARRPSASDLLTRCGLYIQEERVISADCTLAQFDAICQDLQGADGVFFDPSLLCFQNEGYIQCSVCLHGIPMAARVLRGISARELNESLLYTTRKDRRGHYTAMEMMGVLMESKGNDASVAGIHACDWFLLPGFDECIPSLPVMFRKNTA